jgi:hypothetical protein
MDLIIIQANNNGTFASFQVAILHPHGASIKGSTLGKLPGQETPRERDWASWKHCLPVDIVGWP